MFSRHCERSEAIQYHKMENKTSYVYILASKRNGTLYTGATSSLIKRIYEHKNNIIEGFTSKYKVHLLVYYEACESIINAIEREKQIKAGSRKKKISLIENENSEWKDLYSELI